jgi:hypothetical protein
MKYYFHVTEDWGVSALTAGHCSDSQKQEKILCYLHQYGQCVLYETLDCPVIKETKTHFLYVTKERSRLCYIFRL